MHTGNLTTGSLVDRYVYAVIKRLPHGQRKDIEQELRGLIEDMLAARSGGGTPTRGNAVDVLLELGKPGDFAARYRDGDRYLIGPEHFEDYFFVLKLVLASALFGLTVAQIVGALSAPPVALWPAIFNFVSTVLSAAFQTFASVTLVFMLAQRYDKRSRQERASEWDPMSLPDLPQVQLHINRWEPLAAIVFHVLVLILFNFFPHLLGVFHFENGFQTVPIFNLTVLHRMLPLLNLCILMGIVREVFRYLEGSYTPRLAWTALGLNASALVLTFIVFSDGSIWNAQLGQQLLGIYGTIDIGAVDLVSAVALLHKLFLGVLLFAFTLDTAVTAYRAYRGAKK